MRSSESFLGQSLKVFVYETTRYLGPFYKCGSQRDLLLAQEGLDCHENP